MKPETIMIDDQKYIRADCANNKQAESWNGLPYCIIRTYSAGVFAGYIEKRDGQEAVIRRSRGIWYWDGACGLSQLAVDGTAKPENCKFTVEVDRRELTQVIEVIPCTEVAKQSIMSVKVWRV